jgi:hypothetical protein
MLTGAGAIKEKPALSETEVSVGQQLSRVRKAEAAMKMYSFFRSQIQGVSK